MPKHHRRSRDSSDSEDDDDSDLRERSSISEDDDSTRRHRHKKRKKQHTEKSKKKKKKKKKHRKRDRNEDYSTSDSGEDHGDSHRRKKKNKKRRKRDRKEPSRDVEESPGAASKAVDAESHVLVQALCSLFSQRPVFAQELPILLIRLAGGSTFDLRQMNDHVAATALERVLKCLQEFGVQQNQGEWLFQSASGRKDERVLLRVIRGHLDQVGVTMRAVAQHEEVLIEQAQLTPPIQKVTMEIENVPDPAMKKVKDLTNDVVLKYQSKDASIGKQLADLCQTIAQGESIVIDGIPDKDLKVALEEIFLTCGLEKSEMADDDDSSDEDDESSKEPVMGYGLPEHANDDSQLRLAAIMETCRNPQQRTFGPRRPTEQEAIMTYETEDDEGPALPGEQRRPRGPSLPAHVIKAQAEHRELELKATAAGVEIPKMVGGREEWMVVPGKYDFLSNIKAGQPMKNRGFQNKKSRGGDEPAGPIHPAVQAEMDAIMQAHQAARGPSLFNQHRAAKSEEKQREAGQKQGWEWNREKDLDAGRKVDKDALHMVLGGAADNLKTKFQGGFS